MKLNVFLYTVLVLLLGGAQAVGAAAHHRVAGAHLGPVDRRAEPGGDALSAPEEQPWRETVSGDDREHDRGLRRLPRPGRDDDRRHDDARRRDHAGALRGLRAFDSAKVTRALIAAFNWDSLARVLQYRCDRRLDRIGGVAIDQQPSGQGGDGDLQQSFDVHERGLR